MIRCHRCSQTNNDAARYCRKCGTPLRATPPPPPRDLLWLRLDEVIHDNPRSIGLLGAALAFVGGFLPWASGSVGLFGVQLGAVSQGAPAATGLALLSVIAAVLLFHRRGGLGAMIVGGIVGVTALLFMLSTANATPSLGLIVSLVGAGMLVYSGYQLRPIA